MIWNKRYKQNIIIIIIITPRRKTPVLRAKRFQREQFICFLALLLLLLLLLLLYQHQIQIFVVLWGLCLFVCLFVFCVFVCLNVFVCLFVYLFACLFFHTESKYGNKNELISGFVEKVRKYNNISLEKFCKWSELQVQTHISFLQRVKLWQENH